MQAIEGPTAPYLNEEESPNYEPLIPTVLVQRFRVVAGAPQLPPATSAQALPRLRGTPSSAGSGPSLAADYASGTVGSETTVTGNGFAPQHGIVLEWETVVGNRLSGNGWETQRRPLATAVSDAAGRFVAHLRTPDDLGGPHRIIAHANGDPPEAAVSYRIAPSAAAIAPAVVAPGGTITVHVKGVGYTETGNTYTMSVDDAFFGYGCGFNSQGDVTIHVRAPGRIGWHFVDLFPTIYRGQILGPGAPPSGADVNGSYLLLPMLNVVDHPGEQLPAFHLAFQVR